MRDQLADASVKLVVTSPPFALTRQKEYGNVDVERYLDWFMPFAHEIRRILTDDGSFVLDIGGTWNKGHPTRSLYHFEVAIALTRELFHLAQEFFWYNPSKLPSPAEWVTVRRIRVKDAVNLVWWFSKSENPDADNRRVLTEYSGAMLKLLSNGYRAKARPSGWDITDKFSTDHGGAIPPNLLQIANTESNSQYLRLCRSSGKKVHPARFPYGLPEFFVRFLTEPGDLVYDCFGGSNVTGRVCEDLQRRWVISELDESYLEASAFRFVNANAQLFGSFEITSCRQSVAKTLRDALQKGSHAATRSTRKTSMNGKQVAEIPITDRARQYGYMIWPKTLEPDIKHLLAGADRISVVVEGKPLGEKRIDWKYRRISIGPKISQTIPETSERFVIRRQSSDTIEVTFA